MLSVPGGGARLIVSIRTPPSALLRPGPGPTLLMWGGSGVLVANDDPTVNVTAPAARMDDFSSYVGDRCQGPRRHAVLSSARPAGPPWRWGYRGVSCGRGPSAACRGPSLTPISKFLYIDP